MNGRSMLSIREHISKDTLVLALAGRSMLSIIKHIWKDTYQQHWTGVHRKGNIIQKIPYL